MRIDLLKVYELTDFNTLQQSYPELSIADWNAFGEMFRGEPKLQMALF